MNTQHTRITGILWLALCAAVGCEGYNRDYAAPTDLNQSPDKAVADARRANLSGELERMGQLRADYIDQIRQIEKLYVQSGDAANATADVERMNQLRTDYFAQLKRIEELYLKMGDMARASWARQQRMDTEAVVVYPYTAAETRGSHALLTGKEFPNTNKPYTSTRANWAWRQRTETEAVVVYPYATDKAPEQSAGVRAEKPIAEADRLYAQADEIIQSFRMIPLAGVLEFNKNKARRAIRILRELIDRHPTSDKVDDAAYWIGECYKEYLREEDPDNMLALRYYAWALELDPRTPHPARFQSAVVYDFRLHDRKRALTMYHRVLDEQEGCHPTNPNFAAERIKQLTDDDASKERPREEPESSRVVHANADEATPVIEPNGEHTP